VVFPRRRFPPFLLHPPAHFMRLSFRTIKNEPLPTRHPRRCPISSHGPRCRQDSTNLTPAQLDKLLHGIARSRDFTFRLVERINALTFPDADPLNVASVHARDAVETLYQVAAELERVAKLPKWAGGQMPRELKPRSRRARGD
jgi:hypothetical protein